MDFRFSPEEQEIWDLLTKVGTERFRPSAFERKLDHSPPRENLELLGELGILGLCMPKEFGGSERPDVEGILAIERITWACPATGSYAMMSIGGPSMFIARWGTDQQKSKYLPPIMAGTLFTSVSLTEPDAGTALTDLRTRAEIKGDVCLINGQKTFCSSAPHSDLFLVFVRFWAGVGGIGAVLVDRNTPGFTIGPTHHFMGGQSWAELYFDNAEVPLENILFEGNGFKSLMSTYNIERAAGGATMLGTAQIAMDMAVSYAKERKQFGRSIGEFQFVQGRLAEMYMAMESARLLLYKAAANGDDGTAARLDSSVMKVVTHEVATSVIHNAMMIHGASGMTQDLPLEWLYRLVTPYLIAGGTVDIHRGMIAGELIGMRINHRIEAGIRV
ncbi:MAG: acyl-CoA dehydrogenase family protein [Acidimicrobiales bacterium]